MKQAKKVWHSYRVQAHLAPRALLAPSHGGLPFTFPYVTEVQMYSQPQFTSLSQQAMNELLVIHAQDRAAHFATDAQALAARYADSTIYVRDGTLSQITRADMQRGFEQDFQNVTYQEWDDMEPPIVQVSQDASLEWVITRMKVRRTQINGLGAAAEREFIYAGIWTYEKRQGRWFCTANV